MKDTAQGSTLVFLQGIAITARDSLRAVWSSTSGRMNKERSQALLDSWSRALLRSAQAEVRVEGAHHLSSDKPYVYMSNHSSFLDIPALFVACGRRLRMVAKAELGNVPLFGKALRSMDFVLVDRGRPERSIRQLEVAKALLRDGTSVWIAPEGTRSQTGALGPFKKGGFHLALQLGIPIVPTYIEGTRALLPAHGTRVNPGGTIAVRFGAPIPTEGKTKADLAGLMQAVRDAMVALSAPGASDGLATEDSAPAP